MAQGVGSRLGIKPRNSLCYFYCTPDVKRQMAKSSALIAREDAVGEHGFRQQHHVKYYWPSLTVTLAVADGYSIMLAPLSKGSHTINFGGTGPGDSHWM